MSLIALNPDETTTYFLKQDEAKETPFTLGIIRASDFASLSEGFGILTDDSLPLAANKAVNDILLAGLRGWKNLRMYKDGEVVEAPFESKDGKPTDLTLSRLRPQWRIELAFAIIAAQRPSEDDRGKS